MCAWLHVCLWNESDIRVIFFLTEYNLFSGIIKVYVARLLILILSMNKDVSHGRRNTIIDPINLFDDYLL